MSLSYKVKKLPGRDIYECPYCGRAYKSYQAAEWCRLQCEEYILSEQIKATVEE